MDLKVIYSRIFFYHQTLIRRKQAIQLKVPLTSRPYTRRRPACLYVMKKNMVFSNKILNIFSLVCIFFLFLFWQKKNINLILFIRCRMTLQNGVIRDNIFFRSVKLFSMRRITINAKGKKSTSSLILLFIRFTISVNICQNSLSESRQK